MPEFKQLTVISGTRTNRVYHNNVILNGVMPDEPLTPKMARRAARIANRHERFGVGMKAGREWLVHRDELPQLQPNGRYRRKDRHPTRPHRPVPDGTGQASGQRQEETT